jgi:hypothetical protein
MDGSAKGRSSIEESLLRLSLIVWGSMSSFAYLSTDFDLYSGAPAFSDLDARLSMATLLFNHDIPVAMSAANRQITIGPLDAVLVTYGPDAGLVADSLSIGRDRRSRRSSQHDCKHGCVQETHTVPPSLSPGNAFDDAVVPFHLLLVPKLDRCSLNVDGASFKPPLLNPRHSARHVAIDHLIAPPSPQGAMGPQQRRADLFRPI